MSDLQPSLTLAPVLGIVGGIGSGKSLVAAEFVRRGGYPIAADQLGHEALRQPAIRARVVERWGQAILDDQGEVDRRRLGALVFAEPRDLDALEGLVFPYIEARIGAEIEKGRSLLDVKFIVLDAAIMLEAGWARRCDRIVFVDAPRAVRLARLREQRGWTEEELARRERVQMSLDEKRRRADAIVTNAAEPAAIAPQVRDLVAAWGYHDAAAA